ncbi:MAG TPA: collagenase-like protease, partial [Firmicutes bacterium]|nr:collagenase-like protease [Bacillota bacterium]
MSRIELLAPAGNAEKGEIAAAFGADALYFGIGDFNLRARSGNFTIEEA